MRTWQLLTYSLIRAIFSNVCPVIPVTALFLHSTPVLPQRPRPPSLHSAPVLPQCPCPSTAPLSFHSTPLPPQHPCSSTAPLSFYSAPALPQHPCTSTPPLPVHFGKTDCGIWESLFAELELLIRRRWAEERTADFGTYMMTRKSWLSFFKLKSFQMFLFLNFWVNKSYLVFSGRDIFFPPHYLPDILQPSLCGR